MFGESLWISGLLCFIFWSIGRWVFLHLRCKLFNYPPGVYNDITVIGSLLYVVMNYINWLGSIGRKGSIVMCKFGHKDIICINDVNLLKQKSYKEMIGKKNPDIFKDGINVFGMVEGNKHQYTKRRKIASRAFVARFKTKYLNDTMIKILKQQIFAEIDQYDNKVYTSLMYDVKYVLFSITFPIVFGAKVPIPKKTDPIFVKLIKLNSGRGNSIAWTLFTNYLFGTKLANFINHNILNVMECNMEYHNIVARWFNQYKITNIDDDMEVYVEDLLDLENKKIITEKQLIRDVSAMFFTESHSTAAVIEQGFYYLIKHQNVQQTVFDEVNKYKNKYGEFSLEHINELNVLRAFVHETLRNQPTIPINMLRYVNEKNVTINGYNIPYGSYVLANHFYINHCDTYWKKPNEFYIEHFLNQNGKFVPSKNMVTFGVGKRYCVGSSLALKSLLLIFGHVILRYKLIPNNKTDFQSANLEPAYMENKGDVFPVIQVRK